MPLSGRFSWRLEWICPGEICIEIGAGRDPSGLLVEVEMELEQVMIVEAIPGTY